MFFLFLAHGAVCSGPLILGYIPPTVYYLSLLKMNHYTCVPSTSCICPCLCVLVVRMPQSELERHFVELGLNFAFVYVSLGGVELCLALPCHVVQNCAPSLTAILFRANWKDQWLRFTRLTHLTAPHICCLPVWHCFESCGELPGFYTLRPTSPRLCST